VRQTKPILAEEASALMIDYGLLMIRGKAMAVAGGRRSPPPMRQTKPILTEEASALMIIMDY
jgi:hypothetical protein